MIDLNHLEKYLENNRIEAKKALGGLPKSIWETYSAFANTFGGIILLGVEESHDKSLHPINLPDPEVLVKEFWDTINNQKKVSVNILSDKDVSIEEVNGCRIIIITVPRAERYDKPVFLDGNPLSGSYRRNGEGDYKCTHEEITAMFRDASVKSQDLLVLEKMDTSVFNADSIRRYRNRMSSLRPGHVWEELDDCDFLYKLGALGRSEDGKLHPTAAGLLMFGDEYEIVREFPNYFLDYREEGDENERWSDRIVSTSGDWSGNLYDFYFRAYQKLISNLKIPFKLEGGVRIDDTAVHGAIREALVNCLVNADYHGSRGVVIIKKERRISMENPGGFRIDVADAKSGGISDPRNTALIKMFNLINIGERAGSGIPNIYRVWDKCGWNCPEIYESFEPDRITILLETPAVNTVFNEKTATYTGGKPAVNTEDNTKPATNTGGKPAVNTERMSGACQREVIIEYLTDNVSASPAVLAEVLGIKSSRTREILRVMREEGIIEAQGSGRNRIYRLRS